MKITVKFASLFKVYSGVEQDQVDVPEGTTINELSQELSKKYENLPFDDGQTFFVVNEKISQGDRVLSDGDQVRIYQTLSGG